MRIFLCPGCDHQVFFSNTECLNCSLPVGYSPSAGMMLPLPDDRGQQKYGGVANRACANRELIGCNWLLEPDAAADLCQSCSHTIKIPDTAQPQNLKLWRRLERAKRRLFYALVRFELPLAVNPTQAEGTLRFEFLGDELHPNGAVEKVMTGHDNGLITINIAEADDVTREKNRVAMGEPYRTLIGHFRHEVGHHFWDLLVDRPEVIDRFRDCFGDEREDYSDALKAHYANGPRDDWRSSFVSAYAGAHPWEDFAETWAHYFHMVGGLETAYAYGLNPQPRVMEVAQLEQLTNPYHVADFDQLVAHWIPLTVAMNAMNRSIGNSDFYPFALQPGVLEKLRFVHDLIQRQ